MKWFKITVDGDDITQVHSYVKDGNFVDAHRVYTFGSFYICTEDHEPTPTSTVVLEKYTEHYQETLDNLVETEYDIIGNAEKHLFEDVDSTVYMEFGWKMTEVLTTIELYSIEETKCPYGELL